MRLEVHKVTDVDKYVIVRKTIFGGERYWWRGAAPNWVESLHYATDCYPLEKAIEIAKNLEAGGNIKTGTMPSTTKVWR